jgi:hypothetical protein
MKWKSQLTVEKTVLISRIVSWVFFIGFFLLAGLLSELAEINNIEWLNLITPFIGGISLIMLVISCIMPVILLILGVPWLAHAWHRGVNPIVISATPWDQTSIGGKILIYVYSIIDCVIIILIIWAFIHFNFQK